MGTNGIGKHSNLFPIDTKKERPLTISQKFQLKANKRRVLANALLVAPIFALLSACGGGGDLANTDSLLAQDMADQVRPANYQVESVNQPNADSYAPTSAEIALAAQADANAAAAAAGTDPAANAAAIAQAANPAATAGAANAATPTPDPAAQVAAAGNPAAAGADAVGAVPADAGAAAPATVANAATAAADSANMGAANVAATPANGANPVTPTVALATNGQYAGTPAPASGQAQ